ncbi:MAG: acetolactate synthase small subunit [Opitutae bacterium]|jgi:acetolactate synthase-1/3 small subunit|nr:acetolactate synthase small subunit [Opitutae bacterium]|tara:strand:- start:1535 stop:2011 length:477 start_codon:yes stop_codon:yes gene_type:complete
MKHVISVLVENKFGVLARIAGMFSGRGFNIDTLNVGPTVDPSRSRITTTLNGDDKALEQCVKQLHKLIDVIDIKTYVGTEAVGRELILLKVAANSENRIEVTHICDIFRSKIVNVSADSMIIEVTGNENKVKAFLELIEPFGVTEMARTGTVALSRRS